MGSDDDDDGEMLRRSPLRSLAKSLAADAAVISPTSTATTPPPVPGDLRLVHSKNKTVFFTSESCERHHVPGHPECLQRTQVIRERVLQEFPAISVVKDINRVTEDQLLLFHTKKHVEAIAGLCQKVNEHFNRPGNNGQSVIIDIDGDTSVMEGTEEAAMIAAGAVCHAIDLVMDDASEYINAFCGVRPPGHHAEPQQAMGFCLFNNIGIGACHLLRRYPDQVKRVLILDFDVHHGNGTQAKFMNDSPHVCFVSTHQGQFYPFTGLESDRGTHANIVNVPLAARSASQVYRTHFEAKVLPVMHAFAPDFVLVSAGFDAHREDPLADIKLETDDYYWITKHVTNIAWKYAQGRIVSSLEGGYHLDALAASAAAHVRALVEGTVPPKPKTRNETDDDSASSQIDALTAAFAASVNVHTVQELRVTIHFDSKDKLVVLKDRSTKTLLQSCKNKFPNLKKKAKTISIHDAHGTVVTDDLLAAMASAQHLYLR